VGNHNESPFDDSLERLGFHLRKSRENSGFKHESQTSFYIRGTAAEMPVPIAFPQMATGMMKSHIWLGL